MNENLREGVDFDSLAAKYGEELVEQEIDLEIESKQLAHDAFIKSLNSLSVNAQEKDRKRRQHSPLRGTKNTLLKECIPVFKKGLQAFYEKADTGKPGKRHIAMTLFRKLDTDIISMVVTKSILSRCIEKPIISLSTLCNSVGKDIESEIRFKLMMDVMKENHSKKFEKSFYNGLKKRQAFEYKFNFLLHQEKAFLESGELSQWKEWTDTQRVTVGLKLVEIFIETTGLAKLQKHSKGQNKGFYYVFVFDQAMVEYIHSNDESLADLCFKCRPMVIPPKPWTNPFDGGYYLNLGTPQRLIKDSKKEVSELYNDVDMPNVYKAVNAIQSTAWRINKKVLEVAHDILEWDHIPEGLGIPSRVPPEKPVRPDNYESKSPEGKAWRVEMLHWYQARVSERGKRILVSALTSLAEEYKDFEAIYFPHNLDFRGRVYPLTTLSPQGCDLSKGLLEFSEGIPLGEHGATWLAFHGANCYGLDKKPMKERLEWVYSHGDFIQAIADNPLDRLEWTEADSPWEFLAFCFEWSEYQAKGEAFLSRLAVAFDGSCSGLQHFSAMLRDEVGGSAVNLVPSNVVQDIYGLVAAKVTEKLKEDASNGSIDVVEATEEGDEFIRKGTQSMALEWLNFGVSRTVCKRPTMTLCYGSKAYGFSEQILEDTINVALEKNPTAFASPRQSARYLAGLIWDALGTTVVKAVEAMNWLQTVSGLLANDKDATGNALPVTWVTPAGFPVRQKYPKTVLKRISTILSGNIGVIDLEDPDKHLKAGEQLSPTFPVPDGTKIDTRKQRQGIAPNFVHSMDASHLMLTVDACVDQGINAFAMIHDSYGTHAGKADILFRTVREVFVKTYTEHDVLQELHDHVANQLSPKNLEKLPEPPSKGNLDLTQVLQSIYAFA